MSMLCGKYTPPVIQRENQKLREYYTKSNYKPNYPQLLMCCCDTSPDYDPRNELLREEALHDRQTYITEKFFCSTLEGLGHCIEGLYSFSGQCVGSVCEVTGMGIDKCMNTPTQNRDIGTYQNFMGNAGFHCTGFLVACPFATVETLCGSMPCCPPILLYCGCLGLEKAILCIASKESFLQSANDGPQTQVMSNGHNQTGYNTIS